VGNDKGLRVACGRLQGAYPLAINTLWGGFEVASGGQFCMLLPSSFPVPATFFVARSELPTTRNEGMKMQRAAGWKPLRSQNRGESARIGE
jgi:hypothetical protein